MVLGRFIRFGEEMFGPGPMCAYYLLCAFVFARARLQRSWFGSCCGVGESQARGVPLGIAEAAPISGWGPHRQVVGFAWSLFVVVFVLSVFELCSLFRACLFACVGPGPLLLLGFLISSPPRRISLWRVRLAQCWSTVNT